MKTSVRVRKAYFPNVETSSPNNPVPLVFNGAQI